MSSHTLLVIGTGMALLSAIGTFAFLGWLAWGLAWDLYDYLMQQRTRKRMNKLQPRSTRDCFRDMKGTTR